MNNKQHKTFLKIVSSLIIDYIFPLVILNLGFIIIPKDLFIGIAIIVLAFLIFYFARNISQIKTNEDSINEIKKELNNFKKEIEIDKKLLNTLKDIILVKSIQNKK